ncbi:MAG: trypsin-like peptidase domain-containing protein, partial [Nitrospinaceae bacterium]
APERPKRGPRRGPRGPRGPQPPGMPDPVKDFYDRFFGDRENRPRRGMGSGFVIDSAGYILTNNHVIDGANEISVTLELDEEEVEMKAKLIGRDAKTDIALIKLLPEPGQPTVFPYLQFGDSQNLEVGEWVMAIGNPFGLSHTVTVGVVSAKDRSIGAGPYDEYIQTDASINPGNSGGPLINIQGKVIGINTAIISGNSGGNVGIGFAIPINVAKSILKDLREKGEVTRGWLGVMIQKITPELAKSFNLSDDDGALVGDVIPNGPAEKAGIKRGDVIVSFNNRTVKTMEQLPKIVAGTTPGKEVPVEIIREGRKQTVMVSIEVLKDTPTKMASLDPLGMQVQDITPELAKSLQLAETEGVLVSDVTPGQSAAEAGLRRGDVITEVNRRPVRDKEEYDRLTGRMSKGETALMLVRRGGSTIYIAVKVQ